MKIFVPLYARILGWFFLNVVVIAAVFGIFLGAHFRLGLDALVAGPAGERMMALGRVIFSDLRERPTSEWASVLDRFGAAYGVKLYLFRRGKEVLGGAVGEIPQEVLLRLEEGPGRPPPREDFNGSPLMNGRPPLPPLPVALLHTRRPDAYWVIIRPDGPAHMPGHGGPLVLLLRSSSLSAGGLIFDWTPWVLAGAGALGVSFVFWLIPVSRITRIIARMTLATSQISHGRFDVRVEARRSDELGNLAAAINEMAGRLADYVGGQKRFMADIAHELCAPLSRLQMALGVMEERAAQNGEPGLSDIKEEVEELSGLVNEMLSFSKASLASGAVQLKPVRVRDVVERAVRREAANPASVRIDISPETFVLANSELLLRALGNLLRNCRRHAGGACKVLISAVREKDDIVIAIQDNGPGVAPETLPRLFEPFFRVDPSRTRETGGVGLGLSIVKTCVESCGGEVSCRNLKPQGFEVALRLALSAPPAG